MSSRAGNKLRLLLRSGGAGVVWSSDRERSLLRLMSRDGLKAEVMVAAMMTAQAAVSQTGQDAPVSAAPAAAPSTQASATAAAQGGVIKGTVKAGETPLPGVAVTATNTLTGKKYATTTDVDGKYQM